MVSVKPDTLLRESWRRKYGFGYQIHNTPKGYEIRLFKHPTREIDRLNVHSSFALVTQRAEAELDYMERDHEREGEDCG